MNIDILASLIYLLIGMGIALGLLFVILRPDESTNVESQFPFIVEARRTVDEMSNRSSKRQVVVMTFMIIMLFWSLIFAYLLVKKLSNSTNKNHRM